MSIVKPVKFTISQGSTDTAGKSLQKLEIAHRVAIMSALSGRVPETPSHFGAPLGVGSYYGFGADGWYYEGGVKQRTWGPRQSIDDFADNVTDTERWDGTIGTDFSEGGINFKVDTPFGKRLFCEYTGPTGVESFDRKGKMTVTPSTSNVILSSRVNTPLEGSPLGANLDNFVGVGIQIDADDTTYVFVGYLNTVVNPFKVVMGYFDAGALTIGSISNLPAGATAVDVAIEVDPVLGRYRGYFSTDLSGEDFDGSSWSTIGPALALPAAWTSGAVAPRLHASFASGIAINTRYSIADVRVEKTSDNFVGGQRASWWLESLDLTTPSDIYGGNATCPNKLMAVWERDNENSCALTLIDVEDEGDPLLWRRWEGLPSYKPEPFKEVEGVPFWSPGWMDADEGHIVMSRNTVDSTEDFGEVWILSLRWDTIVVFGTEDLWRYPIINDGTSRIMRETGSWGSRRWYTPTNNEPLAYDNYDHSAQPTTSFVGTLANRLSETVVPAVTYGVNIRRCDDGSVYVAYGIQQSVSSLPASAPCYAGIIKLTEGASRTYDRWLFSKDSASDDPWDGTDECWVGVGLSSARAIWWTQGVDPSANFELTGALCRRDWSSDPADNLSASSYAETFDFQGMDRIGASTMNMSIMDSDPAGNEVVTLASGWAGDSWLSVAWYDGGTPANSVLQTYGYDPTFRRYIPVTADLSIIPPSDKFPEWVLHHTERDDADLDLCRITNAWHRNRQTATAVNAPVWAGYVKWSGTSEISRRHSILRGNVIDRGDFTLETTGHFSPPFNAGYKMSASHYLKDGQSFAFRLYIMGERRVYGNVDFYLQGAGGGASPLVEARSAFVYQVGDGTQVSVSNSLSIGTWAAFPDTYIRLRIKRQGQTISFFVFNPSTSNYELVLSDDRMPYGAMMCGMEVRLEDMPEGLAASAMVEIDSFELSPSSSPTGSILARPSDFPVVQSIAASVAGGAVLRDDVPTSSAGHVAIAEGWIFPGWMPYH